MPKKQDSKKPMTPLWVIASFVSFTDLVAGMAATRTTGAVQMTLTIFVCAFPLLIASAFFSVLWCKPYVFYPPSDFGSAQDVEAFVRAMQGGIKLANSEEPQKKPQQTAENAGDETAAEIEPLSINEPASQAITQSRKEPDVEHSNEVAMYIGFFEKKFKEAHDAFRSLVGSKSGVDRKKLELEFAFLRYAYESDQAGMNDLRAYTMDMEVAGYAFLWLGYALSRSKDYSQAAAAFKAAIEYAEKEQIANWTVQYALAKARDGLARDGTEILMKALSRELSGRDLAILYAGLAEIYEQEKDMELRAFALEKALEHDPSRTDLRFGAGWSYAESGLNELAALHYTTAIRFKEDDWASLNNLGVAFEKLHMPIKAVKHYRKAFEMKNPWAGANLAYRYLSAGFADEAVEILEESQSMENPPANVGSAWAELKAKQEEENKRADELLVVGQKQQKLLRLFCDSLFVKRENTPPFAGMWKGVDGEEFEVDETGSEIRASWTDSKFSISIAGTKTNAGAKIKLKKEDKNLVGVGTLLGLLSSEASGYAFVSENGSELTILNLDPDRMNVLKFKRFYAIESQGSQN